MAIIKYQAAAGHLHARDLFLSEVGPAAPPLLYSIPASPRSVVRMKRGDGKPDQAGKAGGGEGGGKDRAR